MPIYKTLTYRDQTQVLIWKIDESEAQLRSGIQLTQNSINRLFKMSSELHRRGFLSIRHLLHAAGYNDLDLYYNESGKPFLKDGRHISISHSFEFTGIVISDVPTGIDIEKQREKIIRIASKFIGKEQSFIDGLDHPIQELSVIWCVKEAMYKLYSTKGLSFKKHCHVASFAMDDRCTSARISYQEDERFYQAYFMELENFMMAIVLPHDDK